MLLATALTVLTLPVAGCAGSADPARVSWAEAEPPPVIAAEPPPSPSPTPSVSPSRSPSPRASRTASPTASKPRPPVTRRTNPGPALVPSPAPAQWTYAATGGAIGGSGRLLRYRVAVENTTGQDAAAFAAHVQSTLNDPRGWTAGGEWGFQRVAADPADFVVWLATPATTDKICGKYGLNTEGEVSCRGGRDVVINLKRWQQGIPAYADRVTDYRHLVVNHEVGHFIGHRHETCPGEGLPAPVMMTSYYGMKGCVPNPWPYLGGTLVTGPPV